MNNEEKKYIKLTPFKMQVLQSFPFIDADFDALTNYELLCKVVDYLNKTIDNVDVLHDEVEEYINKFNELKAYVDNYFDNLDVQEEINNKLDEMAESGVLTGLIKDYIDPIYQTYEEEINQDITEFKSDINDDITEFKSDINDDITEQNTEISNFKTLINGQVQHIDEKVTNATSGSPKGVYATLQDLINADPDHDYIYVVSADGNWYYYSSSLGTWTSGGTYQSTGIADNSIDLSMLNQNLIFNLNSRINDKDNINLKDTIINIKSLLELGGISYSNGNPTTSATLLRTSTFIYVPPYKRVRLKVNNNYYADNNTYVCCYDKNFTYLNRFTYVMSFIGNSVGMYIKLNLGGQNGVIPDDVELEFTDFAPIKDYSSINKIDISNYQQGYISSSNGSVNYHEELKTSTLIYLQAGTYYISRFRKLLKYDIYGVVDSSSYVDADTSNYTLTMENDGFIRITWNISYENTLMIIPNSISHSSYIPYKLILNSQYKISKENCDFDTTIYNNLYGKKLTVLGDSFSKYTNASFDSGIYSGENKVYPYLIGLRNNMIINNMAISGSCMTYGFGNVDSCMDLYQNIPTDSDYILIKYGINDEAKGSTLGTINDNVNNTFYGAYNTLMTWIYNNCPFAKVGIIVTNGLTYHDTHDDGNKYAYATKQIAKKYGIPTLNEWDDYNTPLLNRTGKINVASNIRTLRNEQFRISSEDTHPNYKAQEFESYSIENFLRTL